MENYLGKLLRGALIVGLILLAIACRIAAGVLTEPAWDWYAQWRDIASETVGTQAEAEIPRVRSIADMERDPLFCVEQMRDWDEIETFYIEWETLTYQTTTYEILTLESEERVAALLNSDGDQYDGSIDLWTSPVSRWTPWELSETERAQVEWQELGLTTLDYYVDTTGADRDEAYAGFRIWFPWLGALGLWAAVILLVLLIRLLLRPVRESTRARTDEEKWLAGTHAIWGQTTARFMRISRGKKPIPIRFGGLPRTVCSKLLVRFTLRNAWDINNYADLLETVEYMTRGPGFTNCDSQPARAWQLYRASMLLGMAMVMGWAPRRELVRRLCKVGELIQASFGSWEELNMGYLEAYARWKQSEGGSVQESVQNRVNVYHQLLERRDSPYQLPWNLDLSKAK